jgi:hypothetical protein
MCHENAPTTGAATFATIAKTKTQGSKRKICVTINRKSKPKVWDKIYLY